MSYPAQENHPAPKPTVNTQALLSANLKKLTDLNTEIDTLLKTKKELEKLIASTEQKKAEEAAIKLAELRAEETRITSNINSLILPIQDQIKGLEPTNEERIDAEKQLVNTHKMLSKLLPQDNLNVSVTSSVNNKIKPGDINNLPDEHIKLPDGRNAIELKFQYNDADEKEFHQAVKNIFEKHGLKEEGNTKVYGPPKTLGEFQTMKKEIMNEFTHLCQEKYNKKTAETSKDLVAEQNKPISNNT